MADDEQIVRDVLNAALEIAGYEIILARDGEEALEMCRGRSKPIDLALIDIVMPRLNGVHLMSCLRDLFPQVRIVFMSGYPHHEAFERAGLSPGEGHFLMKPFTVQQVRARVAQELADI